MFFGGPTGGRISGRCRACVRIVVKGLRVGSGRGGPGHIGAICHRLGCCTEELCGFLTYINGNDILEPIRGSGSEMVVREDKVEDQEVFGVYLDTHVRISQVRPWRRKTGTKAGFLFIILVIRR